MRTATDKFERSEKLVLALTYLSYVLFVTMPLGLIVNAVKVHQFRHPPPDAIREQAASRISAEHHMWLLRTAGIGVLLLMVSIGTAYTYFGVVVLVGAITWWLYRLVRGMIALAENRHLPIMM